MKKFKKILGIITAAALASAITGCNNDSESTNTNKTDTTAETLSLTSEDISAAALLSENSLNTDYFSDFDLNTDYSSVSAEILMNGSDVQIKGDGVSYLDKKISVTSSGTYLFSGALSDGQIYVNCEDNVHLVFNGVNISNSDSSPVYIENANNTSVTLVENTVNTLSDTENYVFENTDENEPDAVIFSKDDLSINGSGSLEISANYNEGITSKNDLRIADSSISLTSAGNAIKGKDSVVIRNASLNITSQEDGIKSSNTEETEKGYIVFENGSYNITSHNDAVQAENYITIIDGDFNITTGDGADSSVNGFENNMPHMDNMNGMGNMGMHDLPQPTDENGEIAVPQMTNENGETITPEDFGGFDKKGMDREFFINENNTADETAESQKGFKAAKAILINDGTINVNSADDAIHSNGDISINGGNSTLNAGDDGIHSDNNININNGSITIEKSYEGIEGIVITVNDGDINVTSTDDGFNASDGSGSSMNPMAVSDNCQLNINDGNIYVNAAGDGLDSNGTMNINGGNIFVDGPENDGNCSLDSGSKININGGTVISAGSSGMLETPSDSSKQNSIVVAFSETKAANTPVYITDKNDNVILSYIPSKTYSSVIISSADIKTDESYNIYTGGKVTETSVDEPGELVETVTISQTITSCGNGSTGQMNGGMMHGERHDVGGQEMPGMNNGEMPEMPQDRNGMRVPPDMNGMNPFENLQ